MKKTVQTQDIFQKKGLTKTTTADSLILGWYLQLMDLGHKSHTSLLTCCRSERISHILVSFSIPTRFVVPQRNESPFVEPNESDDKTMRVRVITFEHSC